ncbi:MAG: hypothetical protein GPJ11_00615 [Microcystis aeruginosa L211-101]|nr:hypothetical protein [Microcystis aeruginosa L211-11]NCR29489.1 hypothetical protein [Microcystis aeruginosa L211-101]
MKTFKVLAHLNGLGIKIWVENDKLRYRSPWGIMTTELLEQLKGQGTWDMGHGTWGMGHRADGLFNPKSEPRNLSTIQQQFWEAIGK